MNSSYPSAFRQALQELERALKQKEGLERSITELKTALPMLARLSQPSRRERAAMAELIAAAETGSINLTRAVRLTLAMSERPLTTVEMRDRLAERGFDFSGYSNPMAAIHSALNRMVVSGEIAMQPVDGSRSVYVTVKHASRVPAVKGRAEPSRNMNSA